MDNTKKADFNTTVAWFKKSKKGNLFISSRIGAKEKRAVDESFELDGKLVFKEINEKAKETLKRQYEEKGWNIENIPSHTLEVISARQVAKYESAARDPKKESF